MGRRISKVVLVVLVAVLVALAALGTLVGPAAAFHDGETADCGDAGTFTMKATPNSAGYESPAPFNVLLFEEGGTLSVLRLSINGQLIRESAHVGMAHNNVEEVTCSFTLEENDIHVEITGVFTHH